MVCPEPGIEPEPGLRSGILQFFMIEGAEFLLYHQALIGYHPAHKPKQADRGQHNGQGQKPYPLQLVSLVYRAGFHGLVLRGY